MLHVCVVLVLCPLSMPTTSSVVNHYNASNATILTVEKKTKKCSYYHDNKMTSSIFKMCMTHNCSFHLNSIVLIESLTSAYIK